MNFIKPTLNAICPDVSIFIYSFANKFDNFDYEFYIHSTKHTYLNVFIIYIFMA